jgi:glucokinase
MARALAVDVGGTKLAAGVVTDRGELVRQARRATPRTEEAEVLWRALRELVDEVRHGDEDVCGVGCGGPMAPDGDTVSPLHIPAWRDFPLRARLADLTGLATHVDNDAKALTLGEGHWGAAAGRRCWLGMVVSTGVGGGVVLDGRLLGGASGNAGHIGHVVVEPLGRACACGGRGCLEAEVSGTALQEVTGRPAAEAQADVVARAGRLVGRAVASVCNLLDLGLAVVGGSVALGFGEPFFTSAQAELAARCRLPFSSGARIVPAALGEAAPLAGAAAVGFAGLGRVPGTANGGR